MIKSFCKIYDNFHINHTELLSEIYFVLDIEFGLTKKEILCGKTLSEKNFQKAFEIFSTRIKTGMPIQYILGKTYFMNDVFIVNKSVLIPRDDTEILVKAACDIINENNLKKILDMGTGSGIIAIEIAKHTDAQICACDISQKALEIAKINAENSGQNINFIQSDLFEHINEKFDLIVSNPPYIPYCEAKNLQKEVCYEPDTALFAEDNGLYFYKKIITQATEALNCGGALAFEIGIGQAKQVSEILQKDYEQIHVIKDVSGIERVVWARLKN